MRFRDTNSEDGKVPLVIIIVGGFAAVAILAGAWIGNSAAGLSGDTASCIATAASAPDPTCMSTSKDGSGGTRAQNAEANRPVGPGWIQEFGFTTDAATTSVLRIAKLNFDRGVLRFGGLKLTVAADAAGYLNQLQTAGTKAEALVALQNLQVLMATARADGEVSTANSTLQFAANQLTGIGHEAATGAHEAQNAAATGNSFLLAANNQANTAVANYSTLSLSQLRAYASAIGANLAETQNYYPLAMEKINSTLGKL